MELVAVFLHSLCGTIKRCANKVTSFLEVEAMVHKKIERIQFLLLQLPCMAKLKDGYDSMHIGLFHQNCMCACDLCHLAK